ncbi:MAG TPA: hypothetical protein PK252_02685 [Bacteroidales bacterium]|nr:hypothetical protein [Bacteroidales bacterium]
MFEKELEIFKKIKADLLSQYSGGFVVIKGDEVLGVWQSRLDALKSGIDKYGDVPFLVKNINESDIVINFSRNLIFA